MLNSINIILTVIAFVYAVIVVVMVTVKIFRLLKGKFTLNRFFVLLVFWLVVMGVTWFLFTGFCDFQEDTTAYLRGCGYGGEVWCWTSCVDSITDWDECMCSKIGRDADPDIAAKYNARYGNCTLQNYTVLGNGMGITCRSLDVHLRNSTGADLKFNMAYDYDVQRAGYQGHSKIVTLEKCWQPDGTYLIESQYRTGVWSK